MTLKHIDQMIYEKAVRDVTRRSFLWGMLSGVAAAGAAIVGGRKLKELRAPQGEIKMGPPIREFGNAPVREAVDPQWDLHHFYIQDKDGDTVRFTVTHEALVEADWDVDIVKRHLPHAIEKLPRRYLRHDVKTVDGQVITLGYEEYLENGMFRRVNFYTPQGKLYKFPSVSFVDPRGIRGTRHTPWNQ